MSAQDSQGRVGFRLPFARPKWTYLLLALNVAIWLAMTVAGFLRGYQLNGSQATAILLDFGAQRNLLVAGGAYWRLLTSMFLHSGAAHLLFNSWALYALGRQVEMLYRGPRFLVIYLLSGIGGSLAYYWLGGDGPSVGASGAIFGLVGVLIAYFLVHRDLYGSSGQQQVRSLLTITAVNLVIGFTFPRINNLAHLGGLLTGFGLGWLLAPDYGPPPLWVPGQAQVAIDNNPLRRRIPALTLVILLLALIGVAGTVRWTNSPAMQLNQAIDLLDTSDIAEAAGLLRALADDGNGTGHVLFYLGVAEARLGDLEAARQAWEQSVEAEPSFASTHWNLALVYRDLGRFDDAVDQLQAFVRLTDSEPEKVHAQALIQELSR